MKHYLAIATVALLLLGATTAQAACTRDDISYYLDQGFTQEQITAICTAATETETPSAPAEPEPAANIAAVPPAGGANEDAVKFLREAIEGDDIQVEAGFLHFTARVCIPYGRSSTNKEPWVREACELVRHKVTLQGMKAKREWISTKLFQPRQIYLEGQVERELVGDLDDFGSSSRSQILQNLQTEVKTIVPIKENVSTDRVLEILNKIAT